MSYGTTPTTSGVQASTSTRDQPREDPDLEGFRQELKRAKAARTTQFDRSNAINTARTDFEEDEFNSGQQSHDIKKPQSRWLPNWSEPKFILRLLEFASATVVFGCATSAVVFPAGELPWYDFLIVVGVVAFVVDFLFIASYFFERPGWEWCFDPLKSKLPLTELLITLIWSIIWVVCAIVFASNYSSIFDIVPGEIAIGKLRTSLAFSFLSSFLWVVSTILAYRRYERHRFLVVYERART